MGLWTLTDSEARFMYRGDSTRAMDAHWKWRNTTRMIELLRYYKKPLT
jgi:hypothetical protein